MTVLGTISPDSAIEPVTFDVERRARVSFRQPVVGSGFVDAGWWPHSHDLAVELPALLDVLWTAGRDVTRVTFNLDWWERTGRRIRIESRVVRLAAFRTQDPLLISLSDAWRTERIDLLVIPPETEPDVAERALAIASTAGGTERPARMLDLARGSTRS